MQARMQVSRDGRWAAHLPQVHVQVCLWVRARDYTSTSPAGRALGMVLPGVSGAHVHTLVTYMRRISTTYFDMCMHVPPCSS
jgi:hypothetical protein